MKRSKRLTLKTYEDWNAAGFYIARGERAVGSNGKGVAVFSEQQVRQKSNCLSAVPWDDYEMDYHVEQF